MDETEKGKTAFEKEPKRRRAAWWVEILIAVAVVLVVVGIAIPACNTRKLTMKTTQAKNNLREIQTALCMYAVDRPNYLFPSYLIGGCASSDKESASDPLIREGYLASYPKNPFAAMVNVREIQKKYNDPLRPGGEGAGFGFRFGEDYALMGNVLADVRFPDKYAEFGYPFYDLWPEGARHPKEYIPGTFFYRSCPTLVSQEQKAGNVPDWASKYFSSLEIPISGVAYAKSMPWAPEGGAEMFILGLYGPPNERGEDVLGKTQKGVWYLTSPDYSWVLSIQDVGGYMEYDFEDPNEVSPYGAIVKMDPPHLNTNGIPDCIIDCIWSPTDA